MTNGLLHSVKYRILFWVWWFSWAQVHFIVLHRGGITAKFALADAAISTMLLAGTTLLISRIFQYYTPRVNRFNFIAGLVSVLTLMWLFASRGAVLALGSGIPEYDYFFTNSFAIRLAFGLLINGCMALLSMLWFTLKDHQESEKRKQEAERLAREAELYSLRQQLQPHFLFNSLNSISALVATQPMQARKMIHQLSDFLRGTLRKDDHQWTMVEDEMQHLQLYLDIEKVRFGHRLVTGVHLLNDAAQARLPAMLLQPVVENAIKFGLYDTIGEITITIDAAIIQDMLEIKVANPFDAATSLPQKGTGFGLSSVQRRLYLLFARHDLLTTSTGHNTFVTTIKIPQPDV